MARLIYREKPYEDELFLDYVERIGFLNGFENTPRFCRWLDNVFQRDFCEDYSEFRPDRRRQFVLSYLIGEKIDTLELPSDSIHRRISIGRRTICCRCFKESMYIRGYWHLYEYKTCHVHAQNLNYYDGIAYKHINLLGVVKKYRSESKYVENVVSKLDALKGLSGMYRELDWMNLEIEVVYEMFNCLSMDGLTRVDGRKHVVCEIRQTMLVGESFDRRSILICTCVKRYIFATNDALERLFCMLVWCAPHGKEHVLKSKYISMYSSWALERLLEVGFDVDEWIGGVPDSRGSLIRFLDESVITESGLQYLESRLEIIFKEEKYKRAKQRRLELEVGLVAP